MRFVHTPNAICATTETGRVSGAILKRPPEWANALWDRLAPQVCELLSAQPRGVTCADLIAQGYLQPMTDKRDEVIAELRSGYSRVAWADDLIRQLPEAHEGRNSWLMNYGRRYAPGTVRAVPAEARPGEGYDDRDAVIAELRSSLLDTQRAVGEAQTARRTVELSQTDLSQLLDAEAGLAIWDPRVKVTVRRV